MHCISERGFAENDDVDENDFPFSCTKKWKRKNAAKMNQGSSPNVLLLYVRSGLRRRHLRLVCLYLSHIRFPIHTDWAKYVHKRSTWAPSIHTCAWTLEAAAATTVSRTHRHKYNSLTTFSFCKLCGTVSGNLFIFLFFDDVVAVHTCRCRIFPTLFLLSFLSPIYVLSWTKF